MTHLAEADIEFGSCRCCGLAESRANFHGTLELDKRVLYLDVLKYVLCFADLLRAYLLNLSRARLISLSYLLVLTFSC